jgi:hypothetical protein
MTDLLPEGWERKYGKAGGPEQYRYLLGNGRMLIVLQFSPRKWYYGEAVLGRRKGWTSRGKETTRERAMAMAHAYQRNHYEQR